MAMTQTRLPQNAITNDQPGKRATTGWPSG